MERIRKTLALAVAYSAAFFIPLQSMAQDRGAFRDEARQTAAALRAAGEPKDRCSLGVLFEQRRVVEVVGSTVLLVGDMIVAMGETDVSDKSDTEIVSLLRELPADAEVSMSVERSGERLAINIRCENSRPYFEEFLPLLDLASRGRWNECRILGRNSVHRDSHVLRLRAMCATFASGNNNAEVVGLGFDLMRIAISSAERLPERQAATIQALRAAEGDFNAELGHARYLELVAMVKRWPGGETLWDSTEPNWAVIRLQAEQAIRRDLVDPDSARFEWPHGFVLGHWRPFMAAPIQGYWTCGRVNARNRMGGFTGFGSFVVVVSSEGRVLYTDMDGGPSDSLVASACASSIRFLPPPTLGDSASDVTPAQQQTSIAVELERLARLRDSGALTQAEFEAAKAQLLGLAPARN